MTDKYSDLKKAAEAVHAADHGSREEHIALGWFEALASTTTVLDLIADCKNARGTGEYWKAEKIEADVMIDHLKAEAESLRKAMRDAIPFVAFAFNEGIQGAEDAGLKIESLIKEVAQ